MKNAKILIVDDSTLVVELVRTYLGHIPDCEFHGYTSGAKLLESFVPGEFDCALADLRMPDVDGEELFQRLHELDPLLSMIIMTGYADVKTAVRLMEQGTFTLLEKPFSSEEVLSTVQRAIERTRTLRSRKAPLLEEATLLASLTQEELEVLAQLASGNTNKAISQQMALSPRTLDRRRQNILTKLKVNSVAEAAALLARSSDNRT